MPVFVDNDATCAALAEAYDDDGALVARHLVMFTIGTGVGGGIVIDGRVYRGATGAAAELGHTIIGADLRRWRFAHADDFPQPGSLESLASGTRAGPSSRRARRARGRRGSRGREAGRRGARNALEALRILGERLGIGIANAINMFDPDSSSIGGGVSRPASCCWPARERPARSSCRRGHADGDPAARATVPRPACSARR